MRVYLGTAKMGGEDKMRVYLGSETNGKKGPEGGQDMRAAAKAKPLARPLRLLLSYYYYRDENIDAFRKTCFAGMDVDFFADSGAFSAFTKGDAIEAREYIAWVNRWKHCFTAVAGPDVIGDPEASTRDTELMLDQVHGVPVLPTFHVGEEWRHLDRWQGAVNYMAFGGMVPHSRDHAFLDAWLAKAFSRLAPTMKVHGFGLTNWNLLLRHPFYSVDSSSWTAGFRYGATKLFDVKRGRFIGINMRDRLDRLKHSKLLDAYGLRPSDLRNRSYDRNTLVAACIRSWQAAEAYLEEREHSGRIYLVTSSFGSAPNNPKIIGKALKGTP